MGGFEYLVMPFGLTNAPAVFQALLMMSLRHAKLSVFVYVFMYVYGSPMPSGEYTIRQVFVKCKCKFHVQVSFLSELHYSSEGVDPTKITTVTDWSITTHCKQLQPILGLRHFLRGFINVYSLTFCLLPNPHLSDIPLAHPPVPICCPQ